MESYLDGLVLRNGWSDLMDREGVSQGDIGVFTRTGSLAFSLTVMTRGGLQKKPVYRQPEQRCKFLLSLFVHNYLQRSIYIYAKRFAVRSLSSFLIQLQL